MSHQSAGQPDKPYRAALIASIASIALLLLISATFWSLVDIITIFLTPFLAKAAWLAVGCAALWALGLAVYRRGRPLRIWLPLAICVVGGASGQWVPFTDLWLRANYHVHRDARRRIVTAFETRQLPAPTAQDSTMVVHLPWAPSTSNGGGDVLVSRNATGLSVLFFTYRGILSNYSGYLYRSDTL